MAEALAAARSTAIDSNWFDVAAIVVGGLSGVLFQSEISEARHFLNANPGSVYSALVGLHGALLGFVIASLAITIGYAQSDALKVVRDSGQLRNLYRVFLASAVTEGINLVLALAFLVIAGPSFLSGVGACVALLLGCLAGLRIGRTLWVVFAVLRAIT
jgi:VanZ family protein